MYAWKIRFWWFSAFNALLARAAAISLPGHTISEGVVSNSLVPGVRDWSLTVFCQCLRRWLWSPRPARPASKKMGQENVSAVALGRPTFWTCVSDDYTGVSSSSCSVLDRTTPRSSLLCVLPENICLLSGSTVCVRPFLFRRKYSNEAKTVYTYLANNFSRFIGRCSSSTSWR